jgi:hypothetical protein
MLCFGQDNLITADKVVYFAHTSGTSGSSKMIPCTQDALDILFTTVFQRFFGCYQKSCKEGMPSYPGINLMESRFGYTPYGIAHGAISETLNHEEDTPSYNALPEEIREFADAVNPAHIIPIHTEYPDAMRELLPEREIVLLQDGNVLQI